MDMRTKRTLALGILAFSGVLLLFGTVPFLNINITQPVLGSLTLGQIMGFAQLGIVAGIYKRWVRVQ